MNQPTKPEPAEITRQRLTPEVRERIEQFRDSCQAELDGKPWEYFCSSAEKWKSPHLGTIPSHYDKTRPKPFVLGRTVNGHTLPAGREWHRQDFTEADLEGGWRPHMHRESRSTAEEVFNPYEKAWEKSVRLWGESDCNHWKTRTRRPIITAPEVRAWTPEEMLGQKVREKGEKGEILLIIHVSPVLGGHLGFQGWYSAEEIKRNFVTLEGKPCGVEVGK